MSCISTVTNGSKWRMSTTSEKPKTVSGPTSTLSEKPKTVAETPKAPAVKSVMKNVRLGPGGRIKAPSEPDFYGPNRALFLGKLSKPPAHLKGEYPGDYGWDTAGLSVDPASFKRYRELEVMHGRWAMLGALGCILPEWLAVNNYIPLAQPSAVWFKAGSQLFTDGGIEYLGNPIMGALVLSSPYQILLAQIILMGSVEAFRVSGKFPNTEGEMDRLYPGGDEFDPCGFARDPETAAELKVKEVKNGRLAMVAMLGLFTQAVVTGEGPVENWLEHISHPLEANAWAYATKFSPN